MRVAWVQLGGAASAVVLALLMSAPVRAADTSGVTAVAAEELDKRSKQAEASQGQSGGMSDSSVRVLMTYAFSLIPETTPGPDGKPLPVDKSDANKFVIPGEDARLVIRAATRSAYADVCGLPDLAQANYQAMMTAEEAKKSWSREQLLMINALHLFAVSYFTGNATIIEEPGTTDEPAAAADGTTTVTKEAGSPETAAEDQQTRQVKAPPPPKCPPEQKQKVENAINAYVQAAQAGPAKQ